MQLERGGHGVADGGDKGLDLVRAEQATGQEAAGKGA